MRCALSSTSTPFSQCFDIWGCFKVNESSSRTTVFLVDSEPKIGLWCFFQRRHKHPPASQMRFPAVKFCMGETPPKSDTVKPVFSIWRPPSPPKKKGEGGSVGVGGGHSFQTEVNYSFGPPRAQPLIWFFKTWRLFLVWPCPVPVPAPPAAVCPLERPDLPRDPSISCISLFILAIRSLGWGG